jgi:hypothetical protein
MKALPFHVLLTNATILNPQHKELFPEMTNLRGEVINLVLSKNSPLWRAGPKATGALVLGICPPCEWLLERTHEPRQFIS